MVAPIWSLLSGICVQNIEDKERWSNIGIEDEKLYLSGSIKFDFLSGSQPKKRDEFQQIIDTYSKQRKVVIVVSSFAGEEYAIARELKGLMNEIFLLFVPRHVERAAKVCEDLVGVGYHPILRSELHSKSGCDTCLVVDTTGELRDWTAHADVAIIGKSWISKGGQNPAEAIAARVPVIVGARMDNFEPLVSRLEMVGGLLRLQHLAQLEESVSGLLKGENKKMLDEAEVAIKLHRGATQRTISRIVNTL